MSNSRCTQCHQYDIYCRLILFTSPRKENVCPSCLKTIVKKFEPKWNPFFATQNKETGKKLLFTTKEDLEKSFSHNESEIAKHDFFLIEREKWDKRLMDAFLEEEQDDFISWKQLDLASMEKTLIEDREELVVGWRESESRLIISFLSQAHIYRKGPEIIANILDGNNAYILKKDDIFEAIRRYVKANIHLTDVPFKVSRLRSRMEMYDLECFCFPSSDPKILKMPDFTSTLHYWKDPLIFARNLFLWKEDDEAYIKSCREKLVRKREKIDEELKELEELEKRQKHQKHENRNL